VSVARILCGLEPFSVETLDSTFRYDYPLYEVLLCVARADDPVVPLAQAAMARHPHVESRLLIGALAISDNPKLDNMARAWRDARFEHVVFLDSNLLTPPCYLARIVSVWAPQDGLVSSAPLGAEPQSVAAEIEAAFLNTHAARWQFASAAFGRAFAQGKTLAFRRGALPLGDLTALAAEPAEDAAATRLAESCGRRVRLVAPPCAQPLGPRRFADTWARQLRWARLRRATFPELYAFECLAGGIPAIGLAALAAATADAPVAPFATACAALWYGAEWLLARLCGWRAGAPALLAIMARDVLLPAVWIAGLRGRSIEWRDARVALGARPGKRPSARTAGLRLRIRRLV
jgi:ceramide glucosyltransferase